MKAQHPKALDNTRRAACDKQKPDAVTKEMRQVSQALVSCGVCVARMKLGR